MDRNFDEAASGNKDLLLPVARCLSKEQAAAYLGIGLTLLAELAVPHVRFGRRCAYDKLDVDADSTTIRVSEGGPERKIYGP